MHLFPRCCVLLSYLMHLFPTLPQRFLVVKAVETIIRTQGNGASSDGCTIPVSDFSPTSSFQGQRPGHVFKLGMHGVGYYKYLRDEILVWWLRCQTRCQPTALVDLMWWVTPFKSSCLYMKRRTRLVPLLRHEHLEDTESYERDCKHLTRKLAGQEHGVVIGHSAGYQSGLPRGHPGKRHVSSCVKRCSCCTTSLTHAVVCFAAILVGVPPHHVTWLPAPKIPTSHGGRQENQGIV